MRRIAIAPRPDWRAKAEALGFRFHTIDGAPYWDESAYYAFTLRQVEDDIEAPTQDLHDMAMSLVDEVVRSEALLSRLAIPATYWDWIARSWQRRDRHLYGRMDFAYDGSGPAKLFEFNYDTPTALYEAAFFQWLWLEDGIADGRLPSGADQYNAIQDALIEAFGAMAKDAALPMPLYFASVAASEEDRGTVQYLRDCAIQAGLRTESIAIEDIGLDVSGRWFTDLDDRVIPSLFKLYPLEFMFEERFGPALVNDGLRLLEPAWKAVLSNKGILALLWERHVGHPNLLECHIDTDRQAPLAPGWVRKPFFSREGANIEAIDAQGRATRTEGPYADGPAVRQAWHSLPVFDGGYPLIGSWVVGDRACGMGLREDSTAITLDTSRFVPHAIVD
ncbi:glutathionylspermidine synthase family protein [Lysobacter brunescens]|uniref:Glutathionylspermidine synthase family protein n=1 Tax=Lysobacter brunescens TaxID=262323 RepID=A0ABW2YE75_9GAMM